VPCPKKDIPCQARLTVYLPASGGPCSLMDIFAHGLWSYAALHKVPNAKAAVLAGTLPDLIPFAPYLAYRLIRGTLRFSTPPHNPTDIPRLVYLAYDCTHSFITVIIVLSIIVLITRKFYLFLLAWPLHILMDIPTHTSAFFPTHFIFPISDFHVNGINWGKPWFMLLNYGILMVVYALLIFF